MDRPESPTAEVSPESSAVQVAEAVPPPIALPLPEEPAAPEPLELLSLDSAEPEPALASEEEPASPPPSPTTTETPPERPEASPYRTLANLAVGFVCFFLLVRTFAIEPFGVPTGSMAPALIGNHREAPCPRCGYPVTVGAPTGHTGDHYSNVGCPNCGKRVSLADARDLNGDRLMVDKNVFNVRHPRRWEMGVFHCPDTNDAKEYRKIYVKRVVGLPGESLTIQDGDVYANGELLRKGLAELRETRVTVFEMAYTPTPSGWNQRWLTEPVENDPRLPPTAARPSEPASNSVVRGGELFLDANNPEAIAGVIYRQWNLDDRKEEPIRAWASYNSRSGLTNDVPPVHDFAFEAEVQVEAASPDAGFTCRLFDGVDSVSADVTVGAKANGRATITHDGHGPLAAVRGVSLEPGRTHRVEFSFIDRRAILAIDGKDVLPSTNPPADLPAVAKRADVVRPLQLRARGCRLVVKNLRIYRDTHYTHSGTHGTERPAVMGAAEYFMLGDNSSCSQDARNWSVAGVPEGEFIGKPFLIHQPLRPARFTVGGQDRVFQTVDWPRLRWLH